MERWEHSKSIYDSLGTLPLCCFLMVFNGWGRKKVEMNTYSTSTENLTQPAPQPRTIRLYQTMDSPLTNYFSNKLLFLLFYLLFSLPDLVKLLMYSFYFIFSSACQTWPSSLSWKIESCDSRDQRLNHGGRDQQTWVYLMF